MPRAKLLLLLPPALLLLGCGSSAGYVGDPSRYEPDLFMVDGNNQTVVAGSPFPKALVVQLRDKSGRVFPGHLAYFTAPTSGPSGTFADGTTSAVITTDANGMATAPAFTANGIQGSYHIEASSSYSGGTILKFNLTNQ